MSDRIDQVAQAICEVTSAGILFPWDELSASQREPWRRTAEAAINVDRSGAARTKIPCAISHRARELCSESDEHHARVWFCMTCKMLEQRLMPLSEVLASVLEDAGLAITVPRTEIPSTPPLA